MGCVGSKTVAEVSNPVVQSVSKPEAHVPADSANSEPADDLKLPYQGAAKPSNEDERMRLLNHLGILDTPKENQFDSITRLLCAVFNVPIALVSLVDTERQWFKSTQGLGACRQTDRTSSFCAWLLLPSHPEMLVVPDTFEDARFKQNSLVQGEPYIRFYAGCPLISSAKGLRLGSLCLIDRKPHDEFTAEQYNMLIQFAELAVREIETGKLEVLQKLVEQPALAPSPAVDGPTNGGEETGEEAAPKEGRGGAGEGEEEQAPKRLIRATDCFREGVALVDASTPSWDILYTNPAFTVASGLPADEASSQGFWDLFYTQGVSPDDLHAAVACGQPFSVLVTLQSIYTQTPKSLVVDFRPSETAHLNPTASMVGIPASVRTTMSLGGGTHQEGGPRQQLYYFAILRPQRGGSGVAEQSIVLGVTRSQGGGGSRQSKTSGGLSDPTGGSTITANSASQSGGWGDWGLERAASNASVLLGAQHLASLKQAMPTAFEDVKLGPLIGRGAYGRVYRGGWNGNVVAVKVIEYRQEVDEDGVVLGKAANARNGIFEAVLSSSLNHPNVVHTFQYAIRQYKDESSSFPTPAPSAPCPVLPIPTPTADPQQQPQPVGTPSAAEAAPSTSAAPPPPTAADLSPPPAPASLPPCVPLQPEAAQQSMDPSPFALAAAGEGDTPLQPVFPVAEGAPAGGEVQLTQQLKQAESVCMVNSEVWLIQEFCNRGPLLTAVERGAFLMLTSQGRQTNLIAVLQTLQEVAAAMQFLHQNSIVHGDLTGGNVLLTSSDKDARGFTAKVVDFGLSRVCTAQYLRTRTLGCAEYMPPELITEGLLTPAADVYAFGVLAWEVYAGRRAWEGLKPAQVLRRVADGQRLDHPPNTPNRLKVLMERCMEYNPAYRPNFGDVVKELNSVLEDTLGILQRFLAASSAAQQPKQGGQGGGGGGCAVQYRVGGLRAARGGWATKTRGMRAVSERCERGVRRVMPWEGGVKCVVRRGWEGVLGAAMKEGGHCRGVPQCCQCVLQTQPGLAPASVLPAGVQVGACGGSAPGGGGRGRAPRAS